MVVPITVAAVDDFSSFADALGQWLADDPELAVVGIGHDAADARDILGSRRPAVLLLDYYLRDASADEILAELKQISPETRIVILTSARSPSVRARAIEAGAAAVITKDQGIEHVVATLKQIAAA